MRKVDIDKLRELYGQGLSDYGIAKILGVSAWAVGYWRRKLGLPPNRDVGKERKMTDEKIMKLKQLYEQGLKCKEIARELGISTPLVMFYLTKYNISSRQASIMRRQKQIEDEILRMIDEDGFVTSHDIMRKLKLDKHQVHNYLKDLMRRGEIKRFEIRCGKYGGGFRLKDFAEKLGRKKRVLYYVDERKFIEALSKIVAIKGEGMRASFTWMLKNNNISDEGIKLFYKLQKSTHVS